MSARRRGNVVVAVAAGALLFMGLVALVVDVGSWYGQRQRIQVLADLAAETALRRHPGDPSGDAARGLCLGIFHTNGVAPDELELRVPAPGTLELEVAVGQPRWFSARKSRGGVLVRVRSRARRGAAGRVRLVP